MDRSRHSRGLPRLCTLRQRCRQSPQRSSRVPNRSMWMILYSSVSSTLVTVCAFSPSCFLINVSTSTSILFLSMAVNNSPQRIRCIEVSSPGQPAVKLLEPNHFSSNYTFGTGTERCEFDGRAVQKVTRLCNPPPIAGDTVGPPGAGERTGSVLCVLVGWLAHAAKIPLP